VSEDRALELAGLPPACSLVGEVSSPAELEARIERVLTRGRPLAEGSVEAYMRDLRLWAGWTAQVGIEWGAASTVDVEDYRDALASGAYDGVQRAPGTVNRALSALRRLYLQARRAGLIDHDPCADAVGLPGHAEPMPRALPVETVRRLVGLDACTEAERRDLAAGRWDNALLRDMAMIWVMLGAGLRRAEVVGLGLEDVAPVDGGGLVLHVGEHAAKGRKARNVALRGGGASALRAWLRRRGKKPGPVFPAPGGGSLAPESVNPIVKRRSELAAIDPHVRPHDLRHTFATQALAAGVSLRDVQYALGHADPRTTERYDAQRRAVQGDASAAVADAVAGE